MTSADSPPVDEQAVADYLERNPDFFTRHGELLARMEVEQDSGAVVSFVERQVKVLRDRSDKERRRLDELVAIARSNDLIFARTRKLTLALMDADSAEHLDQALASALVAEFAADDAACFGRGWTPGAGLDHVVGLGADEAPPLPWLFEASSPRCAACRPEEYARLFRGAAVDGPGSVALVPMRSCTLDAVLAIGAHDPQRFTPDLDDVFLRYIGEVLIRTLGRLDL